MKTIISIGTDTKILDGALNSGRVYERVKEYASLVDGKYFCFVFTNNIKFKNFEKQDENFIIKAVYGKNKFLQILNLFSQGGTLRKMQKEKEKENEKGYIFYPQDVFEIGLVSYVSSMFFGGKLYGQCHTDISHPNFRNLSWRNYLQYLIARFVFKRADRIRVVSARMKKYLVNELKIDESKILSLPIYFDLVDTNSLPIGEGRGGAVDFLIMSRIEKEKNIENAILAIKEINQDRKLKNEKELCLKIVGDGGLKKSLIENFKYLSWVKWESWTNNPMLEYQNTNYFLLPSLYEGWGLTAIESASCGTPVVMTNVGCAGEVIKSGENGVVASGFGKEEIKQAILKAQNTNFLKEKIRESVINLDTKEKYLTKLKKFINE